MEYPTNWTLQRVPIAKYLALNVCLWGTILALHSTATSFTTIVSLRTLLGIFEAVCQPSFLLLSSMWYKREEQAEIVTFWYMMNGAVRCPLASFYIVKADSAIATNCGRPPCVLLYQNRFRTSEVVAGNLYSVWLFLGALGSLCRLVDAGLTDESQMFLRGGQEVDGRACEEQSDRVAEQEVPKGASQGGFP